MQRQETQKQKQKALKQIRKEQFGDDYDDWDWEVEWDIDDDYDYENSITFKEIKGTKAPCYELRTDYERAIISRIYITNVYLINKLLNFDY